MIFKYKDTEGVVQNNIRATKLKNAIKKSKEMFIIESSKLFDVLSYTENIDARMDTLRENFLQVKRIDDNAEMYAKELVLVC